MVLGQAWGATTALPLADARPAGEGHTRGESTDVAAVRRRTRRGSRPRRPGPAALMAGAMTASPSAT